MNIRVIGDIRTGKIQPSLTGNAIVDDALIQNFCNELRHQVTQTDRSINIIAEHFFNPTIQTDDLILMDRRISNLLPNDIRTKYRIIDVDHNDLVRGNVVKVLDSLKHLNQDS
ncbi:hypothetical protein ACFQ22_00495 [Lentilactobacillus raoultii]|uniref:Uncharacterized protein n=1 Tax=Lentilactobacillus raoultii TaxID=1987503 RepID=A0ABW3PD77_9LACO|nr:hypothetical protein [Lentilactobacillus raoultii]